MLTLIDEEWYDSIRRLRIARADEASLELVRDLEEEFPEEKGWIWYAYHYLQLHPLSLYPEQVIQYYASLPEVDEDKKSEFEVDADQDSKDEEDINYPRAYYSIRNFAKIRHTDFVLNDAKQPIDDSDYYVTFYALEILKYLISGFEKDEYLSIEEFLSLIMEYSSLEEWQKMIARKLIELSEPFSDIEVGEVARKLCFGAIHLLNNEEPIE